MRQAIKNKGKYVQAWELGADTAMEQTLLAEGKMHLLSDGRYEIFTLEAPDHGEIANPGDYLKIDANGNPYTIL